MKIVKKAGILSAAATLAASVVFVGAAAVANAAPVTVSVSDPYVAPGESTVITLDNCPVGGTLTILEAGESVQSGIVTEGMLPSEVTFAYEQLEPGIVVELEVTCVPGEGSDEAPSSATAAITAFGAAWLEAEPDKFQTGDPVTITAGDFLPGDAVVLNVYPEGSETSVQTQDLGVAGDDFSVTATVTFSSDLECGNYVVAVTGGDRAVNADLWICGAPDATPTPTPTATATPSVTPTATTSPTTPGKPGLPKTGL